MFPTEYSNEAARASLRERLAAYRIDDPEAAFPFSARLARENDWSREHAARVVDEYRRFLYLAVAAGHPVSPSADVDEAWHLHLLYTRSYWQELVPDVLGVPLHHGPTRGGAAESAKFDDWYARTLASYEAAFDAAPPPDIWPSPAERFAPAPRMRQVSDTTHWVIRKPRLPRPGRRAALATVLLATIAGCTAEGSISIGWVLLGGIVLLIAGAAFAAESEPYRPRARRRVERSKRPLSALAGRKQENAADTSGGGFFGWDSSGSSDSSTSCDSGSSCGSSCDGGSSCGSSCGSTCGGGCGGGE